MVIKEFLPNPTGKDTKGEYILLENNSENPQNLNKWRIKDKKGKEFILSEYNLQPQEELLLPYATTKITLNNNGETITLINQLNEVIDELAYNGTAREGFIVKKEYILTTEEREMLFDDLATISFGRLATSPQESPLLSLVVIGILCATFSLWIMGRLKQK